MGIKSIEINNFKSIKNSGEIPIKSINVFVGANGAGKSNFIGFFEFLKNIFDQKLQLYIGKNGRADNFLYFGVKTSQDLSGKISFDNDWNNQYQFKMIPDSNGNLIFAEEFSNYIKPKELNLNIKDISQPGSFESVLKKSDSQRNSYLKKFFRGFKIFHFYDTGFSAKVKQPSATNDYAYLYEDGGNLASFLYRLKNANKNNFKMIEQVVRSIAPFFDEFYLEPDNIDPRLISLQWKEKGSDKIFSTHNFSDGTLRMICITTVLLQPTLPDVIIIDEPELGLHPFAINKLAALLKSAASKSQIIIATQSVGMVNQFKADDIIIVEREDKQTVFRRQSEESLASWLKEYSLGELWEKNILGGRP